MTLYMSAKIGVPYVGTYTYVCSKNNTALYAVNLCDIFGEVDHASRTNSTFRSRSNEMMIYFSIGGNIHT